MSRAAPSTGLEEARRALRAAADAADADFLQRFFRTGPGEYGEGDRFLGVRVPAVRRIAQAHRALGREEVLDLLRSRWHEERLLALVILVDQFRRGSADERLAVYRTYLANTRHIDSWDLVDVSAPHIVGAWLTPDQVDVLEGLAGSDWLWDRRIAILATFAWIRRGVVAPTLHIAERLLHDPHDLIHKAVGWMLREVGQREPGEADAFLRAHYAAMPRTMLRYAIEKLPEERRQAYLRGEVRP